MSETNGVGVIVLVLAAGIWMYQHHEDCQKEAARAQRPPANFRAPDPAPGNAFPPGWQEERARAQRELQRFWQEQWSEMAARQGQNFQPQPVFIPQPPGMPGRP